MQKDTVACPKKNKNSVKVELYLFHILKTPLKRKLYSGLQES